MRSTSVDSMTVEQLPFEQCPRCGDDRFSTDIVEGTVVFGCVGCGETWRYLLGYLVPTSDGSAGSP